MSAGGSGSRTLLGGSNNRIISSSNSLLVSNRKYSEIPEKNFDSRTLIVQSPKKSLINHRVAKINTRNVVKKAYNQFGGYTSSDEEEEHNYKRGGYHPVEIGHSYNDRYLIVSKLGWGHFSTVWKSVDLLTKKEVALKIVKSEKVYTAQAKDEIEILNRITEKDPTDSHSVIHLLDSFYIKGINGTHTCMVFESLGCNLLSLIRAYYNLGLPIPLVKIVTKQILISIEYLHNTCEIIHTDLKPENVLLKATPTIRKHDSSLSFRENYKNLPHTKAELMNAFEKTEAYKCKIIDLGNACWTNKHYTRDVQTRNYRAPEVIVECEYDSDIDMWSVGCIVFELLTGDLLFKPKSRKGRYSNDDDHLALMIELLGEIPPYIFQYGRKSREYFTKNGELRKIKDLKMWCLKDVLIEKYKFTLHDATEITQFMLPMLEYLPHKRIKASEALKHDWIKDIDVNDFSSCFPK